jgi:hypothetical protein
MKVITTVHKAGFEQYGHRWIEGIKNWPKAEFWMYPEGFSTEAVKCKPIESLPRLEAFKKQYAGYVPPNWEFDIVRFANKVFAAYDAFYDYKGLCVWLDADCVTYKKLPKGYIEKLLPSDCYFANFKRAGYHTETGFWIADGKHPEHQAFLDTWIQWFESGEFKALNQWHDCTTLDATIKLFERDKRIKTHNLSGQFVKEMHPMAKVDLGRYLDHTKGGRKGLGHSPENKFRGAV